MAHTRAINIADPLDTQKAGFGARNVRYTDEDIQERMTLDHQWGVSQDTTIGTGDGYHKPIHMIDNGGAPASGLVDTGTLYTYDDGSGITDLWYEDSSANTIQITQGGYLKVRPVCSVYASISQPINAVTKIQFNNEDYDFAGEFDNTVNFRFTVPPGQTGYYNFMAHLSIQSAIKLGWCYLYLYKNGIIYARAGSYYNGNGMSTMESFINIGMYLVPTDFVEFYGFGSSADSVTYCSNRATSLTITKIG